VMHFDLSLKTVEGTDLELLDSICPLTMSEETDFAQCHFNCPLTMLKEEVMSE